MRFNEEAKVIVSTLNPIEAKAFTTFLDSEIVRHEMDIAQAKELIREVQDLFSHKHNKIYVAHPYGRRWGLTDEECEENALKSIEWGRKLIKLGWNPFIPNLFHYVHIGWRDTPDEDTYFNLVSEWIEVCDALFVAEIPPWKHSGVVREIEIAGRLGIPVYYKIEDLPCMS